MPPQDRDEGDRPEVLTKKARDPSAEETTPSFLPKADSRAKREYLARVALRNLELVAACLQRFSDE